MYLNEPVSFQLTPDQNGNIVATPLPKRLTLKTRTSIKLLAWSVPWNQDIPLEVVDLIKPVSFPTALVTEVPLPIPATKPGDQKYEFVPFELKCSNTSVSAFDDLLEFRTNADLHKK
jgi:hypothetical protein